MVNESTVYFPYESMRDSQRELVEDIRSAISERKHIIAHAPTGLGKTVAALSPALALAEKLDLTVMFLTSRNTQHRIAVETTRAIKERFNLTFLSANMIGKRWMCSQSGIDGLSSTEFSDYCTMLRSEDQCEFYLNARPNQNSLSVKAKATLEALGARSPLHPDEFVKECSNDNVCPYEIGVSLCGKSRVIITDYYFAFHPAISENFLSKIEKPLDRIILIVDEGHNLPGRMRELMSSSLTSTTISFARKEAEKFHLDGLPTTLSEIEAAIHRLAQDAGEEKLITREDFAREIEAIKPIPQLIMELNDCADEVRQSQKRSTIGAISSFLEAWSGPDEGFVRFLRRSTSKRGQPVLGVYHNCLDPSIVTSSVIERSHATILMSGTLTPTSMYADLLGFSPKRTIQKEYPSPFDESNKLALIIPKTTTRFAKRSDDQYQQIAAICTETCEAIPGNVAVFFPSYAVRDAVAARLATRCRKTIFTEEPGMEAGSRAELLERFKSYRKSGAVLLAVAAGSFGEGIDLPGDLLSGVIVVGLPLSKPDLETNALIRHYDQRFGKGWDYGYTLPAITKTLQNAGRCIRTETDRGAIVFLDERYSWPQYLKCFPASWNLKIALDHTGEIKKFFGQRPSGSLADY